MLLHRSIGVGFVCGNDNLRARRYVIDGEGGRTRLSSDGEGGGMRRELLWVCVASAIALAGCDSSIASGAQSSSNATVIGAQAAVHGTAKDSPDRAAVCLSQNLSLSGQQTQLSHAYGGPQAVLIFLTVTNTGPSTCQLSEYETNVALVTVADEQPLPVPFIGSPGPFGHQKLAVLPPGGSASGNMQWIGWCGPPPGPLTVEMGFGNVPPLLLASPPPSGLGSTGGTPTGCGTGLGTQSRFDEIAGADFQIVNR
jgi:hypothetical protein